MATAGAGCEKRAQKIVGRARRARFATKSLKLCVGRCPRTWLDRRFLVISWFRHILPAALQRRRAHLDTASNPLLVVRDPATAGPDRPNRNPEAARPAVTPYLG